MTERSLPPLAVQGGCRTPFVKAYGALSHLPADQLGKLAVQGALARCSVSPESVDEVILGNVSGQPDAANLGRVVALRAGIPHARVAHTVNRNCASGMEALSAAWQATADRGAQLIVAGGTESMTNVPLMWNAPATEWFTQWGRAKTTGQRLAHLTRFRPSFLSPVPGLKLGLTDPTCGLTMGQTAEVLAQEFSISRTEQDEFALESHRRALAAQANGWLDREIVPVPARAEGATVTRDQGPRDGQTLAALAKLKPIFQAGGTVTVGNSCPITDGAVALIVKPAAAVTAGSPPPLGYLRAYQYAGCDPRRMGLGPVFAIARLLQQTGRKLDQFDRIEINEAFAAQVLACRAALRSPEFCRRELGLADAVGELNLLKTNVHGGAIALGHPVGATGARLILTLLFTLAEHNLQHGLATLCVGGGQGAAFWVSRTLAD